MNITKAASVLDLYVKTLFDRDCIVTIKSIDLNETSCTAKFTVIADHLITMQLSMSLSSLNLIEIAASDE
jgi:hypothetical protein